MKVSWQYCSDPPAFFCCFFLISAFSGWSSVPVSCFQYKSCVCNPLCLPYLWSSMLSSPLGLCLTQWLSLHSLQKSFMAHQGSWGDRRWSRVLCCVEKQRLKPPRVPGINSCVPEHNFSLYLMHTLGSSAHLISWCDLFPSIFSISSLSMFPSTLSFVS